MPSQLIDSVILITSSDSTRKDFGTGFVIHQDQQATYVLTCAHVVRDVGGEENLRIGSNLVELIALGEDDGFDLAILKVKGLLEKPKLSLSVSGEEGLSFILAGFSRQGRAILSRQISGKLGNQSLIVSGKRHAQTYAWDLKIEDEYRLQPGYSGSPVVDKISGKVLGVAIQRLGEGETGLAISIEALEKIWQEIPSQLLRPSVGEEDNTQRQPPSETDDLSSERGVDYTKLRDLLASGQWREADKETLAVMLKAGMNQAGMNLDKDAYFDIKSIEKFPCTDLRTIDQLWVKYSHGRFGFSIQKLIWDAVGGNEFKFGERVGWRKKRKDKLLGLWKYEYGLWREKSEITYDLHAPRGHLPWTHWLKKLVYVKSYPGSEYSSLEWGGKNLFSRVETCKL
jgi:hypothetical protein